MKRHSDQSGTHLAVNMSTRIPRWIHILCVYFVVVLIISQIEILVQGQYPSESLSLFVMVLEGYSAHRH